MKPPFLRAYRLLGLREEPQVEDYLHHISELAGEFGNGPLPSEEQSQLIKLYRRLGAEIDTTKAEANAFPLLADDGCLVDPAGVFLADAPWFTDRIDRTAVGFSPQELTRLNNTTSVGAGHLLAEVCVTPGGNLRAGGRPSGGLRRSAAPNHHPLVGVSPGARPAHL